MSDTIDHKRLEMNDFAMGARVRMAKHWQRLNWMHGPPWDEVGKVTLAEGHVVRVAFPGGIFWVSPGNLERA